MIRLGTWFCQKGRQVPMTSFPKTSGSLWWCPGSPNLLITCLYQNLHIWSQTTNRMCFSRPWNDPRMEVCWFCFSPLRMLLFLQNLKICHTAPSAASACWFAHGFQSSTEIFHLFSSSEHSSISPRTRGLRSTAESGILTIALVRSRCAVSKLKAVSNWWVLVR